MKTIEDIQSELRALAQELEQLKEQKPASMQSGDFSRLSAAAARCPIPKHPLSGRDEHTQKCYMVVLLSVSQYAGEKLEESLLFAHRIAWGMGYLSRGKDLREEYLSSQRLSAADLDECTALFLDSDDRLMLVLELLLTAGCFDRGKKSGLEYIAGLCTMLKVSKDELTFLSNMAAAVLTQDLGNYKCNIRNTYSIFDGYLERLVFPRKLLHPPERIHIKILDDKYYFQNARIVLDREANRIQFNCNYINSDSDTKTETHYMSTDINTHLFFENTTAEEVTAGAILDEGFLCFYSSLLNMVNRSQMKEESPPELTALEKRIAQALSQPIGVRSCHLLDSESLAREWFQKMRGQINKPEELKKE